MKRLIAFQLMHEYYLTILVVALVMVVAPLLSRIIGKGLPIPLPVIEVLLGIVVGPAVLGIVHVNDFLTTLSSLGGAMLFFVAGTEVDPRAIGGKRLGRAAASWILAFIVLLGIASFALGALGKPALVVAVALSSTALGMLLPALADAGLLATSFGRWVLAAGAVGEFGPLVAIAIFLTKDDVVHNIVVLAVFAALAAIGVFGAIKVSHDRLHHVIQESQHTSGQFAIRVVILLLAIFIAADGYLGLDHLLGAFVAGSIFRLLINDAPHHDIELVESKVQSIAFGFLVPIFFIVAGLKFPFRVLIAQPTLLLVLAAAWLALLVIRGGLNMLLLPKSIRGPQRLGIGVLTGSALPVIVAATSTGYLNDGWTAALLGAGILSLIVFPATGFALHKKSSATTAIDTADDGPSIDDHEAVFVGR